jgi:ABC-type transport system substrate-binding protein
MAIDRDAIINGGWQGYAEPNNTMVPEGVLRDAASLIQGPTFDPEGAAQMLEEAGWVLDGDVRAKDGRELRLTMIVGYPSAEIHRPMPELVQAQLAEIGVAIDIVQTPDQGSYSARLESGEGDLWAEVGNQVDADPAYLPGALYYSPIEGADAADNAYANAFAPGAAFDAKIDAVRAAVTIEEAQIAAAEAMQIMIDQEHIIIPIAGIIRLYGVKERVQNFNPHPVQFVERWDSVTVSE